ncbi:MAG: 5'-nucleotidase C-terminal domain-containing protein, partial [Gammaproteobacteria bacterium]|nr:5'-nucleotidase C-terminal domain-containing protein [Gammaproteobacteria bacterium]
VTAFNIAGYDAAAIGNHEFDFGPAGEKATPADENDDAQGALKMRATEAEFPLLAANLIDTETGQAVNWPNVKPSVLINRNGIKVGVIGLMTENALITTIAANTRGLAVAPLALTAKREAEELRQAGADIVIITAHAGSHCDKFDNPLDLSSCNLAGEIMKVALDLPAGLVDQIIGGHAHAGIAHVVNGIAITSSFSHTRAFGRVDYVFDRADGSLASRRIHPPQTICGFVDNTTGGCIAADDAAGSTHVASYAGRVVSPDGRIVEIAELATQRASILKSERLGVFLETPITRADSSNSAIGHLFTEVVLDAVGGDAVIHNVVGGLRADLPQGDLTYGSVYELYPFDNVVVQLDLTGAELRTVMEREVFKGDRRAGLAGIRVSAACDDNKLNVTMIRADGSEIEDHELLAIMTTDFLATGGDDVLTPIIPEGGFPISSDTPLIREVIANWMREHGGKLNADTFTDTDDPKWNIPGSIAEECPL